MKVAIIGQGYVGLNIAIAAASNGHKVIGLDKDAELIKNLNLGINHVPGITKEVIQSLIQTNDYLPTTDNTKITDSEVIVIAVPTPLDSSRKPDLRFLEAASKIIGEHVSANTLIVNESTSYPGTLRNIIMPLVERNGIRVFFAAAPERVDPGNTKWNLANTPRVVAGIGVEATQKVTEFYSSFCKFIHVAPNVEVAEASKLFENTFRQVNIALVNEFSEIASALNFSAHEAIAAAATKPFGFMAFYPSIGVGGHCIPVDPSYLTYAAEKAGIKTQFINIANQINLNMVPYVIDRIKQEMNNSLNGLRIQIAGVSYKSNISDLRESPALNLISELSKTGARVQWFDPLVNLDLRGRSSSLETDIDLGLIVTPHEVIDFSAWKRAKVKVLDLSADSKNYGWPKFI
jgi:UDP-N-acetyl-D-glucosamine dehydrogenase